LPIDPKYAEIWALYKKHKNAIWFAEEADLSKDHYDFTHKLTPNEQLFIEYIIAFFAASDGIVNSNLRERFTNDVKIMEAQCFYSFQMFIENIHGESYSLLIDTYVTDSEKKHKLLNAITTINSIKLKAQWCEKWINSNKTFSHRLVAFAVVEGIFFSGAFASIFWLKQRGILPGLIFYNQVISRDEGLHTIFACILIKLLANRLKESVVKSIIIEAVDIEKIFICESIPCKLLGMNSDSMSQYIEYCADRLLVSLGYTKHYLSTNPFDFMTMIDLENKTNFFEKRVADYQSAKTSDKTFNYDVSLIK
jgi:ribonucleoside-diphosphate reductase subunit M2